MIATLLDVVLDPTNWFDLAVNNAVLPIVVIGILLGVKALLYNPVPIINLAFDM